MCIQEPDDYMVAQFYQLSEGEEVTDQMRDCYLDDLAYENAADDADRWLDQRGL